MGPLDEQEEPTEQLQEVKEQTKQLLKKYANVPDSKAVLFKAALRAVAACTDGRWNLKG